MGRDAYVQGNGRWGTDSLRLEVVVQKQLPYVDFRAKLTRIVAAARQ